MAKYPLVQPLPGVKDLWSLLEVLSNVEKRGEVMKVLGELETARKHLNDTVDMANLAGDLEVAQSKIDNANRDALMVKEAALREAREIKTSAGDDAKHHRSMAAGELESAKLKSKEAERFWKTKNDQLEAQAENLKDKAEKRKNDTTKLVFDQAEVEGLRVKYADAIERMRQAGISIEME